jgi:hypothetical protein
MEGQRIICCGSAFFKVQNLVDFFCQFVRQDHGYWQAYLQYFDRLIYVGFIKLNDIKIDRAIGFIPLSIIVFIISICSIRCPVAVGSILG